MFEQFGTFGFLKDVRSQEMRMRVCSRTSTVQWPGADIRGGVQ